MIARHYFYSFRSQTAAPQFADGIITARSWLPDPAAAIVAARQHASKKIGCEITQLSCEVFNRV